MSSNAFPALPKSWRQSHLGDWLARASRRFDARVLALMAANDALPLALSHLAARGKLTAAHIQITRHLDVAGERLTTLAQRAGISKQAMGKLVDQCEAWDLVQRSSDPHDARARRVAFTRTGLVWLAVYAQALEQAEAELKAELGNEVATVIRLGLEAYAA